MQALTTLAWENISLLLLLFDEGVRNCWGNESMAFRSETARDEVFSGHSITDAFKGIFRMGGGWGNVSGPGLL